MRDSNKTMSVSYTYKVFDNCNDYDDNDTGDDVYFVVASLLHEVVIWENKTLTLASSSVAAS